MHDLVNDGRRDHRVLEDLVPHREHEGNNLPESGKTAVADGDIPTFFLYPPLRVSYTHLSESRE